ncbi:MAG: hypothetical protein IPK14_16810 [Blastocatellia bacterium]|nr:hypothetical protein [Blastocatellia bacterium]
MYVIKIFTTLEIERITRRYTADMLDVLGPEGDIITPDINTNEQIMAWIMDTYSMHARHNVTAIVTGKPVEMGDHLQVIPLQVMEYYF